MAKTQIRTNDISDGAVTGAKIALQRRDVTGVDAILQSDHKITIYFNSASPFNFTIDQLLINTEVQFINIGTAVVTFVNGTGVTIDGSTTLDPGETGTILYNTQTAPIIVTSVSIPDATSSVKGIAKLFPSADYTTPRTDGALDEATTLSEILNNSFLSQT